MTGCLSRGGIAEGSEKVDEGGAGGCGESGSAERVQEWIAEFLE